MNSFPEIYELIEAFESEPEILDNYTPLFYNTLKFSLSRGLEKLEFVIQPSYSFIEIIMYQGSRQLIHLSLEGVSGVKIEKRPRKEIVYISFYEDKGVNSLYLMLKPSIYLEWGTRLES